MRFRAKRVEGCRSASSGPGGGRSGMCPPPAAVLRGGGKIECPGPARPGASEFGESGASARLKEENGAVVDPGEFGVETHAGEQFAAERAAVEPEAGFLRIHFAHGVPGVGIESPDAELRDGAALVEQAVGEHHGPALVFRDIGQSVTAVLVVGRTDPVEVALHDDVAVLLVVGDGAAGLGALLFGHVLGLQLHAEASGARDVEPELERRGVARLEVGRHGDVRTHNERGEEEARAVLDAGARERFGVVARPHLVEVPERAVLHAPSARGAGLDEHVGVFGADALHHLVESLRVFDPEVRLFVGPLECGADAVRAAVGVPLDVVDVFREPHRVVEYPEDEVLHLGVREVQQPLAARQGRFAAGRADDPFGVLLGQLAAGADHLGFDPDAEFQPLVVGVGGDVVDAFGQLLAVHLPVAQPRLVVVARVFVAEPAVVEHEHFEPHGRRVVDHVGQRLRVEREGRALPAVEQRGCGDVAVPYAVVAGPVVEVAARAARAAERVGVDHLGGRERLSGAEPVFGGVGVGARQHGERLTLVEFEVEAEISAPGQRAGDDLAAVLVEAVVAERQHEGGVFGVGRAQAACRGDALRSVGQQRVLHLRFARPGAVEVGQQVFLGPQRHRRRVEAVQRHGTLLAVADDGAGRDDVFAGVGRIDQFDVQRLHGVGHADDGFGHVVVGHPPRPVRDVAQFGVQVAVGVGHAQGRFVVVAAAEGGVGHVLGVVVGVAVASVSGQRGGVVDAASEVEEADLLSGGCAQDERNVVGPDVDDPLRGGGLRRACREGGAQGAQQVR